LEAGIFYECCDSTRPVRKKANVNLEEESGLEIYKGKL